MMKIKITSIREILSVIGVMLVIICTGTPIQSIYYSQSAMLLLLDSVLLVCVSHRVVDRNIFCMVLAYSASLLLTIIVNGDSNFVHYFGIVVFFISSMFLVSAIQFEKFCVIYICIISCISVYSTLLTLYANLNHSFPSALPTISDGTNIWKNFHYLYFFWGWHQWIGIIRNAAFFREPGVFGAHICIAIILSTVRSFHEKKGIRKYVFPILIIAGITAFSTTTMICLVISIMFFYSAKRKLKRKDICIISLTIVFLVFVIINFSDLLFSKFVSDSSSYISLNDRVQGTLSGIEAWMTNPFFGTGYTNYYINAQGTSANAFVDMLGKYGPIILSSLIFCLIQFIRKQRIGIYCKILIGVDIILQLSSQNLLIYPLFLCLAFYGEKNQRVSVRQKQVTAS